MLIDTQRVYAMTNARIEPEWVVAEAAHLLSRKHFDPRWSRSQGRVVGSEQISLFGLLLAPHRPIHYGGLYPEESREIFVRQALLTGEINTRAAFLADNLRTLEQAREEEAKQRRAGLVADEDWQASWYFDRLPADINSMAGLDAWLKRAGREQQQALRWTLDDLLPAAGSEHERFPKLFALGDARLALHYRFEPGAEDDGVTLVVPLHLLKALDSSRTSWLVPGLVEEKCAALIRGLPKALRRNCVPAPDFARAFREAWPAPSADSLTGELARFLSRATGASIAALDFDPQALDPHLQMNFKLLDRDGKELLAQSRSLDALRSKFSERADRAFAERAAGDLVSEALTGFPDQLIAREVLGEGGIAAFPALVDAETSVRIDVFAERCVADRYHCAGVTRLLRMALDDRMKQARRQLPISSKLGLLYAALHGFSSADSSGRQSSQNRLRDDLVEASFRSLSEVLAREDIRDSSTFDAARQSIGSELFRSAVQLLEKIETILALLAEIRPALEPPLMGFASANLDDLRNQLATLLPPEFLLETPAHLLNELPRYLRGVQVRLQRLLQDPIRDQARMLEMAPFIDRLEAAREAGVADTAGWQDFRWLLEELRISLFAQELGTRGSVSLKRVAKLADSLAAEHGLDGVG